MNPEQAARNLIESQDGSALPEVSPGGLIRRRRRSDWTGQPREEGPGSPGYNAGVDVAAAALAAHDGDTATHSDDVVEVSAAIAERLAVTGADREHLAAAAQLHDVGKVAVPPAVLRKPGPLTEEEWGVIRRHTIEGERILAAVPQMRPVARIVRHSHERYDGQGYPDGLEADEIPLASRIVFCADAFHAMRCDRPYRPGRPAREALAEINANAGTQFDPEVAAALCEVAADMHRQRRKGRLHGASTRRLAALLLTLVVGGSAFAATGAWRGLPFGGVEAEAAPPCGSCAPAALGELGKLPDATAAATASSGRSSDARLAADSTDGASGPGAGSPVAGERVTGRRRTTPSTGPSKRAPAPARRAPQPGAGAPTGQGPAQGRTPKRTPGRSGEAPRRPELPVRLGGGAGGRSDEAPGKPLGPGKFGLPR